MESFKAFGYHNNSNWTHACLNPDTDTEFDFEVLDSYYLDYRENPNGTDFTYGGIGEHAKLEKVKEYENEYLLMHQWSQWQGSELDGGYLLDTDDALKELANHPEIEEIREWLQK